jgi:hypothetical protein
MSLQHRREILCRKYFNRVNMPSNRPFNLLPFSILNINITCVMTGFRLLRLKLNSLQIVLSHMQLERIRSFKLTF